MNLLKPTSRQEEWYKILLSRYPNGEYKVALSINFQKESGQFIKSF